MQDYVKSYVERIEAFAKSKGKPIELLLIGGLAMAYYGAPRYTVDIDAEIRCGNEIYFEFLEYLRKEGIASNISDNISGWGIVPMPSNYKERAQTVYTSDYLTLKILDPVDYVFSKLMRGTDEDLSDIMEVIQRFNITKDSLRERKKLIQFPKDPETLFFEKKFQHLMELMG
ncbi:MAG: hypothetical protein IT393_04135 [Nitrospirae bacterium]|nr:hypothetical protein [Nitrospirota bacterium]